MNKNDKGRALFPRLSFWRFSSDAMVVIVCVAAFALAYGILFQYGSPIENFYLLYLGGAFLDASSFPNVKVLFVFVSEGMFLYLLSVMMERFIKGPAPFVLTRDSRRSFIFIKQAGKMALLSFSYSVGSAIVFLALLVVQPGFVGGEMSADVLALLVAETVLLKGLELTVMLMIMNVFSMMEYSLAGFLAVFGLYVGSRASFVFFGLPSLVWKWLPISQSVLFLHCDVRVPEMVLAGGSYLVAVPGLTFAWALGYLAVACAVATAVGAALFSRRELL